MAKLSVIVPFHNIERFAPAMLAALAANAADDYEFLLIDDASTDGTPELLERALRRIPGSRLITHPTNEGISAARNSGIAASRGEYLVFLDGDDWIARGYLDQLVAAMDRFGTDMVRVDHIQARGTSRSVRRCPEGRRLRRLSPRDAIVNAERTSVDYPFPWAGGYHRRLADSGLLRFDPALRTAEDRHLNWKLHLQAGSMAVIGLTGVFYRRGVTTSLTQAGNPSQLDFLESMGKVLTETRADPDADRFLPKVIRSFCSLILHHEVRRNRLPPALRRELADRSGAALKAMPPDLVEAELASMNLWRATQLRRLRARRQLTRRSAFD